MTLASPSPRRMRLRRGLGRLAGGLIAYGVVGLLVAVLGVAAIAGTSSRMAAVGERLNNQADSAVRTLDRAATALDDAARSATSFSATLERTSPTLVTVADTLSTLQPTLRNVGNQAESIQILGSRPLAALGSQFIALADDLAILDASLRLTAEDLLANQDRLQANATSLAALSQDLADLSERLETGLVEESIDDVTWILMAMLVLFVLWAAVPAIGALALGLWLRSELAASAPVIVVTTTDP